MKQMDGIINLNKPAGISSHGAVATVRRLVPGVKVGHGGTLDPAATGVLPLCLGRATRIAEYLFELRKGYRATITLGVSTTTGDAEGAVISRSEIPCLEQESIKKIFRSLTGVHQQKVPAYAAVKHRGRPLYDYARHGEEVPVKKRTVEIYRLELLSFCPLAAAQIICEVECSRGTYIRALAVEIGRLLGCGAHLHTLERLFVGPFKIDTAIPPEQLAAAAAAGELKKMLLPMDRALLHFETLTVSDEIVEDLRAGRAVSRSKLGPAGAVLPTGYPVRVYDLQGQFKALARCEEVESGTFLKTVKFLAP
ncbi:MAG: tRNA pseudouridine(55) synthase TruB [Dethiobacteria bacterium]